MSPLADVLAHGVGTRSDLPIPVWLALYGSGAAVAVSFAALAALWRTPRLAEANHGRPAPPRLQAVLDSPSFRYALQSVVLAVLLLVIVVALVGPTDPPANLAPWAFYVTFWVGLVPASLLLGPVWRLLNPLRLLHALLRPIAGPVPDTGDRLERIGYWPAVISLVVFLWLELVYPERATPAVVGSFIVVYAIVHLVASMWFGERWFDRGDGFEVYSSLIGRLAPLGRRADGRLALRNPLKNAATLPSAPGLAAVVVVLVGSTAFDGLSRTRYWTSGPGAANDVTSGTLGLAAMIAITGVLYVAGTMGNGWLSGQPARQQPGAYAHTLVPIAVGYAIAHYFSLLLLDGQLTWILASDPFQTGVDVFGTAGMAVNYALVSISTIAYTQVTAIVIGHILAVVLAHDRALVVDSSSRSAQHLPLLVVMIAYTVGGLGLLFGA
ncbi:MAG TPA: hypothetical protein VNA30_07205 [Mycobacteriales bacterium]|nr:hypothetical protein [Mycobacteriales bacterium]